MKTVQVHLVIGTTLDTGSYSYTKLKLSDHPLMIETNRRFKFKIHRKKGYVLSVKMELRMKYTS